MANNAAWGPPPPNQGEGVGPQVRPMSLKVHYTFDKASQEKCLARWHQILQIQTLPLDDNTWIGVVNLRTCLQAVSTSSPELAAQGDIDYNIYAYDYSEPDTPLVGQGMLSWILTGMDPASSQPPLVTGRVTTNKLGIFGHGAREILEVRLKLTAITKVSQPQPHHNASHQPMHPVDHAPPPMRHSASNMSENNEWNSFIQSNPNIGHQSTGSARSSPALAPARPFNSNYEVRHEFNNVQYQGPQGPMTQVLAPKSRPGSVEPYSLSGERRSPVVHGLPSPANERPGNHEAPMPNPIPVNPTKPASRPASRASSKPPTGRPRGRPRKKPKQAEGSTSGCEEATDVEEGPARKRAKPTQVERSNSATFGSAPESLRVAASISGSIRNMRPIGLGGEASGSHLQEVPRAPTPVPNAAGPGAAHSRSRGPSNLRSESTSGQDASFNTSFSDMGHSMSQGQDARSPVDSIAPSPSQTYSDEASPADIGSSPPVPRSTMYSVRSSPAPPSSPVLPPMPKPVQQPDSGFMSGGLEGSRAEDDTHRKTTQAPVVAKPKPRRSRPKKKQTEAVKKQEGFIIQNETPGPPELLPQTSIYNPPHSMQSTRPSSKPKIAATVESPAPILTEDLQPNPVGIVKQQPASPPNTSTTIETPATEAMEICNMPHAAEAQSHLSPEMSEGQRAGSQEEDQFSQSFSPVEQMSQGDFASLDDAFMNHLSESFALGNNSFSPDADDLSQSAAVHTLTEPVETVNTPMTDTQPHAASTEPELPTIPLGGSAVQQLTLPMPLAEPVVKKSATNTQHQTKSVEPELPTVPASDPIGPQLTLPMPRSEAPHPQTDTAGMAAEVTEIWDEPYNKNYVKRQSIKQKLDEAIANGVCPQYCRNCGALQTPTWRKIWKQIHPGAPAFHDYSEKPGCVTAINILKRDELENPTSYEMIKKTLGPSDDRSAWTEVLLCNPCGIWFSKWKAHRPPQKWENDEKRLGQTRKKRNNGGGASRSKKARTKSDAQTGLTSEACVPTDPLGPTEAPTSPKDGPGGSFVRGESAEHPFDKGSGKDRKRLVDAGKGPGSTHSRGSGTAVSPIALEDDEMGDTRRLLFPSPRKDGEQKVLGELAVNVVHTSPSLGRFKAGEEDTGKENNEDSPHHDLTDLFGPTPVRPSTPPPKSASSGPFKTPTRQMSSHRPVTRSVTRSMRSVRSIKSPGQLLDRTPSRTPTRTPRSSSARRRSPRNLFSSHLLTEVGGSIFETPLTKSINEIFSETGGFDEMGSPHRGFSLDLNSLPNLASDDNLIGVDQQFDFTNLLSTDGMMPSSPPLLKTRGGRQHQQIVTFGGSLTADGAAAASQWGHNQHHFDDSNKKDESTDHQH